MKIFINYALNHAFHTAQSRDKIGAIKHMIHHGMEPIFYLGSVGMRCYNGENLVK